MLVFGTDGKEWILNLDQIRMVTNISREGLRIIFSENHVVNFTGPIVKDLLTLFADNCIVADGTSLPEYMERLKSQSPEPEQAPSHTPES